MRPCQRAVEMLEKICEESVMIVKTYSARNICHLT